MQGRLRILVTGVSGYLGPLVAARLSADGHRVIGLARDPRRAPAELEVLAGDATSGAGLARALDGIDVAYFLIHSMDASDTLPFASRERQAAERFARTAAGAGVGRVVYLGGLAPATGPRSPHLDSRLQVEEILLAGVPGSVALRASIVIGARSRSFRFLVRLVERLPVLALGAWRDNRTAPVDERDVVEMLARCATSDAVSGQALDVGGPDIVTYGQLVAGIAELMMVDRPTVGLGPVSVTPIASRLAAVVAGEQHALVGPLMESLHCDLVPRDEAAARLLGVRLHSLSSAIEHALAVWEASEPLAAR